MMRRLMTIVIMLLMLSSCYYFNQVVDDTKESNKISKTRRKDGDNAYQNDKYKEGVYKAINDIVKRPLNKTTKFKEISIVIPEDTEIKTGYGIPIGIFNYRSCIEKKLEGDNYYGLSYNEKILGVEELAQKIIKANGFVNTCK